MSRHGFAAICDASGVVREVMRNDLGVQVEPGMPIAAAMSDAATEKAYAMLREISSDGAATGWELTLRLAGGMGSAWCAGTRIEDGIVVIAATSDIVLEGLLDDLTRVNNEQTNALRTALKLRALERADSEDDLAGLMAVNNELTAAQRALARAHADLRRLDAEKDALLGMAAHDLRNPLFATRSYAEFLRMDPSLSPAARKMVDRIHESSCYMLDLVNDLLDLSVIEAGQLALQREPTDLDDLVRTVVEVDRLIAERKDVTLLIGQCETGPPLPLDRRKMEQVVHNLIDNAVKFSPAGSDVEIDVHRGDAAVLAVRDHGVGMTDEQQQRLFRPFTRGVEGTAGERSTGLGMAIVKRVVEGHGGRITVTSGPDAGTTVAVTLPEA